MFGLEKFFMGASFIQLGRVSRSVVKKNKIMKLYIVNEMIGQLYCHVTLTI